MGILENYQHILSNINNFSNKTILIIVSKTFPISHIKPLIDHGHTHFGENRVQESINKWKPLLDVNNDLKIHLIGKLQTNKVVEAIHHFSFIHSLDSEKLALKVSKEQQNFNKNLNYFIQVNIGQENQKSGISISDAKSFINFCRKELKINIIGLMCLPPFGEDPIKYFNNLKKIASDNDLSNLSMGMSNDYLEALKCGSNYLRIGSLILGQRDI
jgi:pyridoxal phosphate enzyme (YggS family)